MLERNRKNNRNRIEVMCRTVKAVHFVITVFLFCVAWVWFYSGNNVIFDHRYSYYMYIAYVVMVLFFFRIFNAYSVEYERVVDLVYSQTLGELLSVMVIYALVSIAWHHFYDPTAFLLMILVSLVINCIWANSVHSVYFRFFPKYRTVVIYREEEDRRKIKEVEDYYKRFRIVKKISGPSNMDEIRSAIKNAEAVLVAGVDATLRNGIVKQCLEDDIKCFFAPHVGDIIVSSAQFQKAFSTPILSMSHGNSRLEYLFFKRVFDIVISVIGLIVLSPLMLITAIAIYLYDKESPIYKQVRLTRNGEEFVMYKFRSMRIDAEEDGVARLTKKNDSRITPVGVIIRACRIDEIPQLLNVLKGDMSIVGPRPERPELAKKYEEQLPSFALRLKVKAGLLGYAQVYGRYNTNIYENLEMDLLYINKMSLLTDLTLVCATIKVLFMKRSTEGFD